MTRTTLLACACLLCVSSFLSAATPVHVVPSSHVADARQPQAASDGKGQLYVTYGSKNDIYCSVSSDAGQSFADPVRVGSVKHLSLGMRRGPRIAVSGDAVVITAIGGDLGGGKDGDLLSWRSADQGKTWQGPVRINDVTGSAREGLHAMAGGPSGELYAVWLDLRTKGMKIYGAASPDGGASWTANTLVYQSPSGSVCECCHPSAVYDGSGKLHVMWRNSLDGNRDLFHTVSADNGGTFSQARLLGAGHWKLDACPMDGGAIAVAADGTVTSVWRREKKLYLSSGDDEQLLAHGEQPWVARGQETFVVWLSKRPGELWLRRGDNANQKLAENAADPIVVAATGHSQAALVCWEQRTDKGSVIMATTVSGNAPGER